MFDQVVDHRDLHSFPTRRSSDLPAGVEDEREIGVRKLGGFDRLQGGDEARPAEGKRLAVEIAGARVLGGETFPLRSEEHTSELQSRQYLVCRLLLEKKKTSAYET